MPSSVEPPGGLPLKNALEELIDSDGFRTLEKARAAAKADWRTAGGRNPEQSDQQGPQDVYEHAIQELRTLLGHAELVAWGSSVGPSGMRREIPASAWRQIRLRHIDLSYVTHKGKRLHAVRIHRASEIRDWKAGVTLARAMELAEPQAWSDYQSKYVPGFVIGDPVGERLYLAGGEAESHVVAKALQLLRDRKMELRTLHPPHDPAAKWVSLSVDVLNAITLDERSLREPIAFWPDGTPRPVRVFLPAGAEVTMLSDDGLPPPGTSEKLSENVPIKKKVELLWHQLDSSQKALIHKRGGTRELARILLHRLPGRA